ncbi:PrpF domain-containing protein [Sulfolobus sp. E11-6]|uniref:PrpF domain-containing protein n=1 Tax=Sulfolobus sp. E11-6 TaxID=2663020 RepID=UPI001295FF67|nr:PrpF domain-containing protein [Sulfolobus sp. E11-6]QGA68985.1 hypothetical protein GFS33_09930 [Sulfolobus sp. E11-6]
MAKKIRCSIIRGGTTKGVFIRGEDLPSNASERDEIILKIFGSGDKWQIDGIGGGNQFSSKVMIVWQSKDPNYDVEYMFGQVGVGERFIDWNGVDGNLTAAVAVYAYNEGLVKNVNDTFVKVRCFNINTEKTIITKFNKRKFDEEKKVNVEVEWINPCGSFLNKGCYPTSNGIDVINLLGKNLQISVIDAIGLIILINAHDIGLTGYEMPSENIQSLKIIEELRKMIGKSLGLLSPLFPLPIIFSAPRDYYTVNKEFISKDSYDLSVRVISLGEIHHALSISGGIAVAVASSLRGNVLDGYIKLKNESLIRLAHPKGISEFQINKNEEGEIRSVIVNRECRMLMEGYVYY